MKSNKILLFGKLLALVVAAVVFDSADLLAQVPIIQKSDVGKIPIGPNTRFIPIVVPADTPPKVIEKDIESNGDQIPIVKLSSGNEEQTTPITAETDSGQNLERSMTRVIPIITPAQNPNLPFEQGFEANEGAMGVAKPASFNQQTTDEIVPIVPNPFSGWKPPQQMQSPALAPVFSQPAGTTSNQADGMTQNRPNSLSTLPVIRPAQVPYSSSSYVQEQPSVGEIFVQPSVGETPVLTMDEGRSPGDSGADYDSNGNCDDSCANSFIGIGGGSNIRGRLSQARSRVGGCLPCLAGGICNVGFDNCGYISQANRYFIADALYWKRSDGGIIGTNFGGPGEFPWNWGWRGTIGWRQDSIVGYEATYFGFLPFENTVSQTSGLIQLNALVNLGQINARFFPSGGLTTNETSSFFNAVKTKQELTSQLHSVELSRVRFGWDVLKTSLGFRYMWFDDQYRLDSLNGNGALGALQLTANNHLFGPDVGLELLYDVGRRISFSGKVKGGGYIDPYRAQVRMANDGTQYIGNQHTGTNLSASLELGANAYFRLGRHARLRGGYDSLWLYNVMSVTENFPTLLTPLTGFTPDDSRNVTFHGASFGIEFYR